MRLWLVPIVAVAVVFAAGCDEDSDPVNDDGQVQDVVSGDTATPDTIDADDSVALDTGTPDDVTVDPDVVVPVDTFLPDNNVQNDEGTPDDVAAACPTGVATGAACYEAGSCAVLCDDETFRTECMAQADETTRSAFTAFDECFKTSGCETAFAGEQITECVALACGVQTNACFSGSNSCSDMWTCRKDCDAADAACPMRCFSSGTTAAQALWVAYKDCILAVECASEDVLDNGWPTWDCEQYAQTYCSLPYQGCFPPI